MFTIRFTGKHEGQAEAEQELSLLHAAKRAEVALDHRCGGHARCGTCKVTVVEGAAHLTERGAAETRVLGVLKAGPDDRLACQCWTRGDVTVTVD